MKVLLAIDHSKCSADALTQVLKQNWSDGTEFHVLTAVEPIYAQYGVAGGVYSPQMFEAYKEFVRYSQQLVELKVSEIQHAFPNCTVSGNVVEDAPARAILEQAKNWDADLIVLGSHGRTGLEKFILGSVAQKVATNATCSVEIVRPKNDSVQEETKLLSKQTLSTSGQTQ